MANFPEQTTALCPRCQRPMLLIVSDENPYGDEQPVWYCEECDARMRESATAFMTVMSVSVIGVVSALAAGAALREFLPSASAAFSCALTFVCFVLVGVIVWQLATRR